MRNPDFKSDSANIADMTGAVQKISVKIGELNLKKWNEYYDAALKELRRRLTDNQPFVPGDGKNWKSGISDITAGIAENPDVSSVIEPRLALKYENIKKEGVDERGKALLSKFETSLGITDLGGTDKTSRQALSLATQFITMFDSYRHNGINGRENSRLIEVLNKLSEATGNDSLTININNYR